jgi:hypothetical protein
MLDSLVVRSVSNARIKLPEQNYASDKFSMRDKLIPVSLNELLDLGLRQSFNIGVLTFKFIQLWHL